MPRRWPPRPPVRVSPRFAGSQTQLGNQQGRALYSGLWHDLGKRGREGQTGRAGLGAAPSPLRGLRPVDSSGLRPASSSGLRPVSSSGLRPVDSAGLRPVDSAGLRPVNSSGLRPASSSGLRPVNSSGLRPVSSSGLRPVNSSGLRWHGARTDNRIEKRPWPVLLALTRA